jgi:polyadenylate-binding protein
MVDSTNLFVKFLPSDLTDENFKDLFSNFGVVKSCKIVRNEKLNSLGYGFVRFSTKKEAELALNKMNGYKIGKKILLCKYANLKKEEEKETNLHANLFVFHLPTDMFWIFFFNHFRDDVGLYNLFHKYGKIESVKVCTNEKGESKGYGFVKFSTLSSAVLAVSVCNGIKIGNKHLKVSFKTQE